MAKVLLLIPFGVDAAVEAPQRESIPMDVDIRGLSGAPSENRYDECKHYVQIVEAVKAAEKEGYEAVVVGCQGDPGVKEAREEVNIPVMSVTETSLHICAMLGMKTCIVAPNPYLARRNRENVRTYGFENSVSVRCVDVSAREGIDGFQEYKRTGKSDVVKRFVDQCIEALEQDGADVIMSGCGAVVWMDKPVREELKARGYDVPFVNPFATTVEIAKAYVNLGLKQSNHPHSPISGDDMAKGSTCCG